MQRNCPNCGAPYDPDLDTCPYCHTLYFDLSAIDMSATKPFYLKLKFGDMVFTSKVLPKPDAKIEVVSENLDCVDCAGHTLAKFNVSNSVDIDIGFQSVADRQNRLFTIKEKV